MKPKIILIITILIVCVIAIILLSLYQIEKTSSVQSTIIDGHKLVADFEISLSLLAELITSPDLIRVKNKWIESIDDYSGSLSNFIESKNIKRLLSDEEFKFKHDSLLRTNNSTLRKFLVIKEQLNRMESEGRLKNIDLSDLMLLDKNKELYYTYYEIKELRNFLSSTVRDSTNSLVNSMQEKSELSQRQSRFVYFTLTLLLGCCIILLSLVFSSITKSLSESKQELEKYSVTLEQKVKERTEKLEETNIKLDVKLSELEKANQASGEAKAAMLNLLEDARELEQELKEERDRVKTILTSMGDGLIVTDINSKIILINPEATQLLGTSPEETLNQPVTKVYTLCKKSEELSPEENPIGRLLQCKEGKNVVIDLEDDIYLKTKSGRRFPVALTATPLKGDDAITGAIIVFRDISVIKQLDEAKIGFISVASHQLRTPLTSMRWFSEMLMGGDAGKITEEQKHFVERIYEGIDRMIALVNLLLQIARVEAGRVKIEPVPVDLKATTQGVMLTLKNSLEQKSQQVVIKTDPDPFPSILLDQEIVWQVIQNLISNASRYSPEKSTISVSIVKKDGEAEYSVSDQGIGIPKEYHKRIFEKFFRAENALKMVPEGSGLGLALVKLLVEGWDGKIWFESEEGKGSTFHFTVPLEGMKARSGEVKLAV